MPARSRRQVARRIEETRPAARGGFPRGRRAPPLWGRNRRRLRRIPQAGDCDGFAEERPPTVSLQAAEKDGAVVYRSHFLAAFEEERSAVAVVQEDLYGQMSWTFYPLRRRADANRLRQGHLLYRRR